mmetsp:Transcript_24119/g.67075  ORF Transcript_24119/g.67075 Transcript_24119/m.67075 type:complete len:201 (+) Transcript_24119:2758-3360(+)
MSLGRSLPGAKASRSCADALAWLSANLASPVGAGCWPAQRPSPPLSTPQPGRRPRRCRRSCQPSPQSAMALPQNTASPQRMPAMGSNNRRRTRRRKRRRRERREKRRTRQRRRSGRGAPARRRRCRRPSPQTLKAVLCWSNRRRGRERRASRSRGIPWWPALRRERTVQRKLATRPTCLAVLALGARLSLLKLCKTTYLA